MNRISSKLWTQPYFKVNILKLKCTKFDFGCGFAPDPAGELRAKGKGRQKKGRGEEAAGEVAGGCIRVLRGTE